ncbi:MAG TPA: copper homeostasis protein CutC [Chitinophagaceae bacterium]|nr:copper homeostasis protein CutC [Chitinophagaceae bacterium]
MSYLIEIATSDVAASLAAVQGGADRIELCDNLSEGGTTQSYGTIRLCREKLSVALFPIIRPRGGDFFYTTDEFEVMLHDVSLCKQLGCDGVVIGLLTTDGAIDVSRTKRLVDLAYPLEVTFHRAFDRCRDPFEGLEQLIEAGCTRILTSGQQPAAPDGADLIAELVKKADDRVVIMPGSGVRKDNIQSLAQKTGAVEFHSSLRTKVESRMQYRHPAFANSAESYSHYSVLAEEVRKLKEALGNPDVMYSPR